MDIKNNKEYIKCSISDDIELFTGYFKEFEVNDVLLKRLSKELGFTYELYKSLYAVDSCTAESMIISSSKSRNIEEILLLVDTEEKQVLGYSLETDRPPILNSEFVPRIISLVDSSESIKVDDIYYTSSDIISSILIKKLDTIDIEEKYEGRAGETIHYTVGILLVNDEIHGAYSRLCLYINDHPLYLPASYYNATATRYRKSTSSSIEALEVLALKIINDLRDEELYSRIQELHYKYRVNKTILISYEEYNSILRVMRKIPTIIEENSYLDTLLSKYGVFEEKYSKLEDQKSSYIWRCTALGDLTIDLLVSITIDILNEVNAPSIEYYAIRELLGSYISNTPIAKEIAREDI